MIKFFRKIRQSLLSENKFSKYLIYAIGEIILVVAGILIALSLNNWNENRKAYKEQVTLLKGINENLIANTAEFQSRLMYDSIFIKNGEILISILENKNSIYNDSMEILFGPLGSWLPAYPKTLAYENLKTKGLSLIINDNLQAKIITLFDDTYVQQRDIEELYRINSTEHLNMKYKYFKTGEMFDRAQPNDFDQLKNSNEFMNYLSYNVAITKQFRNIYKFYILKNTKDLIEDLEKEINRLEN